MSANPRAILSQTAGTHPKWSEYIRRIEKKYRKPSRLWRLFDLYGHFSFIATDHVSQQQYIFLGNSCSQPQQFRNSYTNTNYDFHAFSNNMYGKQVDDARESGVSDMDEHAGTCTWDDIHRLLPEPVYDELVIVCWSCYTTCLQTPGLSAKLCCCWSLYIKLYRLLSEVSTTSIDYK